MKTILLLALIFSASGQNVLAEPRCESIERHTAFESETIRRLTAGEKVFGKEATECIDSLCPRAAVKAEQKRNTPVPESEHAKAADATERLVSAWSLEKWKRLDDDRQTWLAQNRDSLGRSPTGSAAVMANIELAQSIKFAFNAESTLLGINELTPKQRSRLYDDTLESLYPELTRQDRQHLIAVFEEQESLHREFLRLPEVKKIAAGELVTPGQAPFKALSNKVFATIDEIRKSDPTTYNSIPDFRSLQRANLEKIPREVLIDKLERAFGIAQALRSRRGGAAMAKSPPPLIRLIDHDQKLKINLNEPPKKFRDSIRSCAEKLTNIYAELSHDKDVDKAMANTELARIAISENLGKLFSPESAAALRQRVEQTKYVPPPTRENFHDQLANALTAEAERSASSANAIDGFSIPTDFKLAMGYNLHRYDEQEMQTSAIPCETFDDDFSSRLNRAINPRDETDVAANQVSLSISAVKSPAITYSIALHELMHVIDPASLSGKLKISEHTIGVRSSMSRCLEALHGKNLSNEFDYLSGEDFADLGVGSLPAIVSVPAQCLGFKLSSDNELQGPFRSETSEDGHSAPLFRLLHVSKLRDGKLNPTCEKFVRENTSWKFKDCR